MKERKNRLLPCAALLIMFTDGCNRMDGRYGNLMEMHRCQKNCIRRMDEKSPDAGEMYSASGGGGGVYSTVNTSMSARIFLGFSRTALRRGAVSVYSPTHPPATPSPTT